MIKEYDIGNGRKVSVIYDNGVAQVSREIIEQILIPEHIKAEKYRWHDLKADPKDVPENDSRVLLRIDNKLNEYVCATYHDGNFGLFARHAVLGRAHIPPYEGEE